jgi:NodT family efflux transporter outer membrane factor (OMF) lipoprotein
MVRAALSIALIVSLAGCITPPPPTARAPLASPEHLGLGDVPAAAVPDWWAGFQDPQLSRLIEQAQEDGPTLAEAQARLREALAQAEVAHAATLPSAKLDASALRQRAPENYLIPPPLAGGNFWMAQAGATLNWDLDFWGKQADAVKTATALSQASSLDVDNTRLMLAGAVTQAYVELYRSYALADIAAQAEEQRERIIKITRRRVDAGLDTRLELRLAESQLPQARVDRAQALAASDLAVHQLAAITGQGAQAYASFTRPTLNVDAGLTLPTALPLNLLARRPDVLAARLRIDAADSQRLAARAAFYPDISLTALAGFGAFGLDNLVKWNARGYGAGPLISLPLFDGGRLRAQYKGSEAQLDGVIAEYNDTVLGAVRQTADQLTRIDSLARQRVDQQQTLEATEDAYRIAEERYRVGLANYLSVLNAETQLLTARKALVDIMANQVVARVTLLLAVGGSFDAPAPAPDFSHLTTRSNP